MPKKIGKPIMEAVEHEITLDVGWFTPKCPFCQEDIEAPQPFSMPIENDDGELEEVLAGYRIETCQRCGAAYSYEPACDNEDLKEHIAVKLGGPENAECIVIHKYDYKHHCFNDFLKDTADTNDAIGLGHLWFARKKLENTNAYNLEPETFKRLAEIVDLFLKKKAPISALRKALNAAKKTGKPDPDN